jgi:hypothetical protein
MEPYMYLKEYIMEYLQAVFVAIAVGTVAVAIVDGLWHWIIVPFFNRLDRKIEATDDDSVYIEPKNKLDPDDPRVRYLT